jgi:hypothetical protein
MESGQSVSEAAVGIGDIFSKFGIEGMIIFTLLLLLFWREIASHLERRENRLEREQAKMTAQSFADSASKLADAIGVLRTEVMVLKAIIQKDTGHESE